MTKKSLVVASLLTGGILFSCSESKLLDQINPNQASTATFWKTSDDAIKGINAAYSGMQDRRWSLWQLFLTDLSSDEGYSQSPWTDLGNLSKFIVTDYNIVMNRELFESAYQGLYRTHQVLENVPNIKMDATVLQKRILAEAKLIRAYFYYDMANIWGNVPLVLKFAGAGRQAGAGNAGTGICAGHQRLSGSQPPTCLKPIPESTWVACISTAPSR